MFFCNVPSITFNTSISIHLVLIATNKAGDIFFIVCLYHIQSAYLHLVHSVGTSPQMHATVSLLSYLSDWPQNLRMPLCLQAVAVWEQSSTGRGGKSTDKYLGFLGWGGGGVILRCILRILRGYLGNP